MIPADSFKIEMKEPYSPVYMTCIEQAKKDLREKAHPELVSMPESIDEYDTVILAYPNYWGTMPMAVVTFLEHFDFKGKTVLPLCTNEGSGMGSSERDISQRMNVQIRFIAFDTGKLWSFIMIWNKGGVYLWPTKAAHGL